MARRISFEHGDVTVTFFECRGCWRRDVWNKTKQKAEAFYFGAIADDPIGKRAMYDKEIGWLAREEAIRNGTDKIGNPAARKSAVDLTISDIIREFMQSIHDRLQDGGMADSTFRDYQRELTYFGQWKNLSGAKAEVVANSPTIFADYVRHLISSPSAEDPTARHLGLDRRATVIRYLRAVFHWAVDNNKISGVKFGSAFKPPSTDPDAKAVRNERLGLNDDDDDDEYRIYTARQIAWLIENATPLFKAMILVALNCGFGPSDLARMKWKHLDLETGRLKGPRRRKGRNTKGIRREAYLWPETITALKRVMKLKHCRVAFQQDKENALVFLTRKGHAVVRNIRKMEGNRIKATREQNSVSITFGRLVKKAEKVGIIPTDSGLTFYALRHTFRTHADNCTDLNAVRRVMGRKLMGMDHRYIHGKMPICRLWKVSNVVRKRVLPESLPLAKPVKRPKLVQLTATLEKDVLGRSGRNSGAAERPAI